jgi:hypothetical protein
VFANWETGQLAFLQPDLSEETEVPGDNSVVEKPKGPELVCGAGKI